MSEPRKFDEPHKIDGYAESTFGIQIQPREDRWVLRTHRAADCAGPNCCIHNPSDHPLKNAPMNWRADRGMMERICDHGIGHPDPDDLAFKALTRGEANAAAEGVHGCDGCCFQ